MKAAPLLAMLLGLCLPFLAPSRAHAELEVSFDYFYDALAPYGTWVDVEGYGPCWSPANVDADWAPYTEGEWVFTDAGWTWVGDEEFAGIVYHYGRWILANNLGWCWVPGYDWGPAWVSWRDSDEYVGWAPLTPEVTWEPDTGVGVWVDEVYGIGPSFYHFCHHRDFGDRHLRTVILARTWNTAIIVQTVNITNITFRRDHRLVYCGGPAFERASRFSSRPIAALRLDHRIDFDLGGKHLPLPGGSIVGNTLAVVAPRVLPPPGTGATLPKTAKVVSKSQLQRGWVGKGASGDLDSVRKKIQTEAQGRTPKTDPARPVAQTELQFVPATNGSSSNPSPVGQPAAPPSAMPPRTEDIRRGLTAQPTPAQTIERAHGPAPFQAQQSGIPAISSAVPRQSIPNNVPFEANLRVQQQETEVRSRNEAERQRMQETQVRQQNAEAQARQQAAIQQQGREAMERQRQERAQTQMEQQRVRQQQQAAEMARERERRSSEPPAATQTQSTHSTSRKEEDKKKQ